MTENPKIVAAEQAEDDGLWFKAVYASEAYLQAGLRRLTAAVESDDEKLRAFVREVAAIDPLAGGGDAKYFVTAEFIARARALAHS